MKLNRTSIIIDTDPGIDDAVAIAIALTNQSFDVKLMTTVAGNVSIEYTTKNALKLVEFFKKDIPVAQGASEPLLRELEDASFFHGETGMKGYEFPPVQSKVVADNAIDKMREVIMESHKPTTIVALGPLTNIALLIKTYPEVKEKINQIVFMGGGFVTGNTSSVAEFNIYNDPHAAEIVFRSNIKKVMLGLDVTTRALVASDEIKEIKKLGEMGHMLHSLFSHYRAGSMKTGLRMHDACTIAYLLKPSLFDVEHLNVQTVMEGPAIGATVMDRINRDKGPKNIHVCTDIDGKAFSQWIVEELHQASTAY